MPDKKDKYFEDLLDDVFSEEESKDESETPKQNDEEVAPKDSEVEEKELSEEEQREKNKNAEEARKRRAKEAREKEEEEARQEKEERKKEFEETNVNKLGEQLSEFTKAYPNVDLAKLDSDENFKNYIDGKLLGRKDFTELYEDYIDLMSSVSDSEEVKLRHQIKSQASSGTTHSSGEGVPEIYSEEDFNKLVERMPTMKQSEIDSVWEKFQNSLKFYKKK